VSLILFISNACWSKGRARARSRDGWASRNTGLLYVQSQPSHPMALTMVLTVPHAFQTDIRVRPWSRPPNDQISAPPQPRTRWAPCGPRMRNGTREKVRTSLNLSITNTHPQAAKRRRPKDLPSCDLRPRNRAMIGLLLPRRLGIPPPTTTTARR
jgi:hypothetical protein